MTLPIPLSLEPMEAEPVDTLPEGPGWSFEPKYDGFRCVVFRDGDQVLLQSRRQRPLARFFPEVAQAVATMPAQRCVLDGELVIRNAGFDALQLRLHPAASRIARLSHETPATFVAFDLLADTAGKALLGEPFAHRRAALEALPGGGGIAVANSTRSREEALLWLKDIGHGLDGIVAKRLDLPYRPGERAMLKYKLWHTIDCVVGGVYRKTGSEEIEYLLLGLSEFGRTIELCRPLPGTSARSRVCPQAASFARRRGVHRQPPRWAQPLVEAGTGGNAAAARTGGGSQRRCGDRREVPPRLPPAALAHRQGSAQVHHGPDRMAQGGVARVMAGEGPASMNRTQ